MSGFSPEDHLHVLGAAPAAHPPVHVPVARGGDEEVALPRLELHLHRGRGKGSANITSVKIHTNEILHSFTITEKAPLIGAFNQEKALVGAFSVIVQFHRLTDLRH